MFYFLPTLQAYENIASLKIIIGIVIYTSKLCSYYNINNRGSYDHDN